MIATVLGIITALILWFHPFSAAPFHPQGMEVYFFTLAILFLFIVPIGLVLSWVPLLKAEKSSTPHVLNLVSKDLALRLFGGYLIAFSLYTLFIVPLWENQVLAWISWVVLLGLAIDSAHCFGQRIMGFFNPFVAVDLFAKNASKSIQNDREIDLCHWIDGLSEIAIKGIQRQSTSVAHQALDEEQNIIRLFLEASKSIAHRDQDKQTKELGITDKVSYVLFYLLQRLDVVYTKAIQNHLEMTCSHIITLMGKITIDAAKYDISLASLPLRFLGKFAKKAAVEGFEETALTASCVFSETANAIVRDIDVTYLEIKDPYLSIINGLETLSKISFQKDKTTNIGLLAQPFKDLRALFDQDKLKEHQDAPVIRQNIDRVLGEFEALQLVMKTMPKIPVIEEPPKQSP